MHAESKYAWLLDAIAENRKDSAFQVLEKCLHSCIACTADASNCDDDLSSRIGGIAVLPQEMQHPCDRSGQPMLFIAQLNFAELPNCSVDKATSGILMLFWNSARDYSNPKDRNAFRCIWIAEPEQENCSISNRSEASIGPARKLKFAVEQSMTEDPNEWAEFSDDTELMHELSTKVNGDRKIQILGRAGRNFKQMQEIAAFAGNGIGWSPARTKDEHFSHLLESAKEWQLLAKIDSMPQFGLDLQSKSMFLLIRRDDFDQQNYDKSWLLLSN